MALLFSCGDADNADAQLHVEEDANTQYELGLKYAYGKGVPKDAVEAAKWYRKAAEQGDAVAQTRLGQMYASGEGVPKDATEAVKWYRLAAEQGYAPAQFALGTLYANGEGVAKDAVVAHAWLNLAASASHPGASESRERIAQAMTPEQIAEAQSLSRELQAAM